MPGDRFTEDKLAPLAIPKDNVERGASATRRFAMPTGRRSSG